MPLRSTSGFFETRFFSFFFSWITSKKTSAFEGGSGLRIVLNEDGSGNSVPLYIVGEAERDRDYADAAAADPEIVISRGSA